MPYQHGIQRISHPIMIPLVCEVLVKKPMCVFHLLAFAVCCLLPHFATSSYLIDYSGYHTFQISPENEAERETLRQLQRNLTFVRAIAETAPMVWLSHPGYEKNVERALKKAGISSFTQSDDNFQEEIQKTEWHKAPEDAFLNWDRYYSYGSVTNFLNRSASFRCWCKKTGTRALFSLGKSFEGRDIMGININPAGSKFKVFIEAGIHAREWIAPAVATYIINELTTNYKSNKEIADLADWYIIPVLNPDGYEYSRHGDRFWRKNRNTEYQSFESRKLSQTDCFGVDLNRNYDTHWDDQIGGAPDKCDETFRGRSPNSEPETQVLINKLRELNSDGSVILCLSLHAYSTLWISPWGFTKELPQNYDKLNEIMTAAFAATQAATGTKYKYGSLANTLYEASGTLSDYALEHLNIQAPFTIELRPGPDGFGPGIHWKIGFMLPPAEIPGTGKETWAGISAALKVAVKQRPDHRKKLFSRPWGERETVVDMEKVFNYITENQKPFIDHLREAVAIQSVSTFKETRPEVRRMVHWVGEWLKRIGTEVEIAELGDQTFPDGTVLPLPPALLGVLGKDPKKRTVVVYGHLDVVPAKKEDGWNTDPFVLTEIDGKLFGRGSTDDKGPVLAWIHAIEAYQKTGQEIPVNIKFILEGMEESGSLGLDKLLEKRKETFFSDVGFVVISDNYWLGPNKPCLTYALRGITYFFIEVEGGAKDLHSGSYGGAVQEAVADLMYLMSHLVTNKGEILIPGLSELVAPVTPEERELYRDIDFSLESLKQETEALGFHSTDKIELLMRTWRFASLSIHGIEGAFSEPGAKTVIPRKVIGKFSIRIVPNQSVQEVQKLTTNYLNQLWAKRGSQNKMNVRLSSGGAYWFTDPSNPHYEAGKRAIKRVYGVDPDLTRGGGSIPITLTLEQLSGKSVMLLPIGANDDGAHSQNEKINIRNYIEGTKVMAVYLEELSRT